MFEGPLDLLLYLVQKNKLNIYDIPIAEVLQQYMETIDRMKEADLDVATEFLDHGGRPGADQIEYAASQARGSRGAAAGADRGADRVSARQEAARRLAARNVGGDIYVRQPAGSSSRI